MNGCQTKSWKCDNEGCCSEEIRFIRLSGEQNQRTSFLKMMMKFLHWRQPMTTTTMTMMMMMMMINQIMTTGDREGLSVVGFPIVGTSTKMSRLELIYQICQLWPSWSKTSDFFQSTMPSSQACTWKSQSLRTCNNDRWRSLIHCWSTKMD